MKLIVGLGNPGRGYANNRHNLGFMCLNDFAKRHGLQFDKKQGQARTASGEVAGHKVILARPQTYMNQSGQAVSPLVRKFNITLEDLIVVHDDLDLPVGKIRIRQGGGSAGHKGVQSIIAELGSPDFARIRVGIGQADDTSRPGETDVIGYVLSGFSAEERPVISRVIATVGEAILCYLTEGLAVAMNKYN
ncbi:MAG: aminoacyl-tRNA hydrolase [Chloroflexi bacterium]|nr:aminoacyl-tRNA hydrolase [Chloroflexota bacterium]